MRGATLRWEWKVGARLLFYVVAAAVASLLVRNRWYPGGLVLALALPVGGWVLHTVLHAHATRDRRPRLWVRLVALLLVTVVGVAVLGIAHWAALSLPGFVGLTSVGFGLGQLMAELRESRFGAVAAAVSSALLLLCALGFVAWSIWALPAAVVLADTTVGLVTEQVLNVYRGQRPSLWGGRLVADRLLPWLRKHGNRRCSIAAGVAICVGFFLSVPAGGWKVALAELVGGFALLGMAASDVDGDIALVLVAAVIALSQIPAPFPTEGPTVVAGRSTILALGDSFMSGEGARAFYKGTNGLSKPKAEASQCRRAPTAYAVLLARAFKENLEFLACSGAKIGDVQGSQLPPAQRGVTPTMVLLSVGGNDAGFSDLLEQCLGPGDCSLQAGYFKRTFAGLVTNLPTLYEQVARTFPGVPIDVIPYPVTARDTACGIFRATFSEREQAFLTGFVRDLDTIIQDAVAQADADLALHTGMPTVRYVSSMVDAFAPAASERAPYPGGRYCDVPPSQVAANYITLSPVENDPNVSDWIHDSLHPDIHGHERMYDVLQAWLASPGALQTPTAVPEPPLGPAHVVEGRSWLYHQTRDAFLRHLPGGLLLAAGLWLLWLRTLADVRPKQRP